MNTPDERPDTVRTPSMAYVVPTKDHPEDLAKMLQSLCDQTDMPDQVVVVDGSDPPVKRVVDCYPQLPITYVREFPPSLARQRNAGMRAVLNTIDIAGYLDDDVVLEPGATAAMRAFWAAAGDDVGGASFTVINQPDQSRPRLHRFFLMHGEPPGSVLSSGFPVQIPFVEQAIQTEWLYGGATMFRRAVIETVSYDEWFQGWGFLEDLDYSYRVSLKWRLFVLADARVWHFSSEMSPAGQYDFGRQQIFNRLYFVRKIGGFSRLAVIWGLIGTLAMNFIALFRHPDRARADRFRGNLRALLAIATFRRDPFSGDWKN